MKLRLLLACLVILFPAHLLFGQSFSGWKTSRTKHFVFVYEPRDKQAVVELESFSEEVYAKVTSFFDSYPTTIWCVVQGRTDTANGDFSPLPPHLDINVAPPAGYDLGLKGRNYLRELLTHELTHYVHLDYDRGLFAALAKVLGPAVATADAAFLPGWMIEGITTNTETLLTEGGRGRDPFFHMIPKGLLYDNRFFTLPQAAYQSAFPPNYANGRIYVAGYLMVHYLLSHFGPDTFTKIHQRYVRFPLLGPWSAIKAVTGQSAEEIFSAMESELSTTYAVDRTIPDGRRVSPTGVGNYMLPVVTDRGWFEYRDTLGSPWAIVQVDPSTHAERVILKTVLTDLSSLTATKSGNELVFASFDVTNEQTGTVYRSDLFRLDPRTGAAARITKDAHLLQPALSPDGSRLVAVQIRENYTRLVEVDPSTGALRLLFSRRDTILFNPTFSPGGRTVAFALNDHGKQAIWVLPLTGPGAARPQALPLDSESLVGDYNLSAARRVTSAAEGNVYYPRFAGDSRIVYSAAPDGALALYTVPLSGGKAQRIVRDPVAAWAGEMVGDRMLYSSYSGDGYVVKEKSVTLPPIPETGAAAPPAAAHQPEGEAAPALTGRLPDTGSYVDWPRFLYWVPLPGYLFSPIEAGGAVPGVSTAASGLSLLGRSSYAAELGFRTDALQPYLSLDASTTVGTVGLSYSLIEGYSAAASPALSVSQSAGVTIPLISQYLLGTSTSLSIVPGVADLIELSSSSPFTFSQAFGWRNPAFTTLHAYALNLGAGFLRIGSTSARELIPEREIEGSATLQYYPTYLSAATSGLDVYGYASFSLPSLLPNQVVRVGVRSGYTTRGRLSASLVPLRGGFLPPGSQGYPGRTLVSLDYLASLALLDVPLPFELNLQGIAGGIHAEGAASWDPAQQAVLPDPNLYVGMDLMGFFGLNILSPIPIGIGVEARVAPSSIGSFNPSSDLALYFFVGTNSSAPSSLPTFPATMGALEGRISPPLPAVTLPGR